MRAKNSLWLMAIIVIGITGNSYGGGDIVYEEATTTGTATATATEEVAPPAPKNNSRNGPFVGFEGSYVFDMKSKVGGEDEFVKGNGGGSLGVNIGAKDQSWRALIGFEHYERKKDNQNYDRTFIQGDYFPLDASYSAGNLAVNPYLGLNVGWLNYKTDGDKNKNGFSYGGEAGFTKSFGNNWDLDVGLRYILSDIEEVDHIGTANMGLHYYY